MQTVGAIFKWIVTYMQIHQIIPTPENHSMQSLKANKNGKLKARGAVFGREMVREVGTQTWWKIQAATGVTVTFERHYGNFTKTNSNN